MQRKHMKRSVFPQISNAETKTIVGNSISCKSFNIPMSRRPREGRDPSFRRVYKSERWTPSFEGMTRQGLYLKSLKAMVNRSGQYCGRGPGPTGLDKFIAVSYTHLTLPTTPYV